MQAVETMGLVVLALGNLAFYACLLRLVQGDTRPTLRP